MPQTVRVSRFGIGEVSFGVICVGLCRWILFENEYRFGKCARVTTEQSVSFRKCFTIRVKFSSVQHRSIQYIEMEISASFRLVVLYAIVIALILIVPSASGANFLATLFHPMGQASQNHFVGRITSGLIARGHTVTVLAADNYNLKSFNRDTAATRIIIFKVIKKKINKHLLDRKPTIAYLPCQLT